MLRRLLVVLPLFLATADGLAAKDRPATIDVAPGDPLYADIVGSAQAAVSTDLGLPVRLDVTALRAGGGFAFLAATVMHSDGRSIDFRETHYEEAIEDGLFDGPHLWALLGEHNGVWSVLEQDIGPTDAWYAYWPSNYQGASCELVFDGFTGC